MILENYRIIIFVTCCLISTQCCHHITRQASSFVPNEDFSALSDVCQNEAGSQCIQAFQKYFFCPHSLDYTQEEEIVSFLNGKKNVKLNAV